MWPRRRFVTCSAAALLGLSQIGGCASGRPAPSDRAEGLGPDAPLLPLFRALSLQEDHGASVPLTILQIGDSHTANDSFSGRMRTQFQARFGDAGRGILPPGVPYPYYRPARVTVTQQGWTVQSSFRAATPGPFGLTGLRQHADRSASMTLTAANAGDLARIEIEVLRQRGGGTIDVSLDTGTRTSIATAAASTAPFWVPVAGTPDTQAVTVTARGNGPVDLLAWSVARGTPGVIYANLGTVGASVDLLDRWDPAIVRAEMAHLAPALIVLAFGTNEGFKDSTDPADYAAGFAARLRALHAAAPGAALLVLGPPDGARHVARRTGNPGVCGDPNWQQPPRLDAVRAAQRTVAARENAFFWDWSAAMGGRCSMLRWAGTDPPFAAPDHVHLYAPGYQATADVLFQTLMAAYARYRTPPRAK